MMINVESARQQMVEQQVRAWDVFDARTLAVMSEVKRELFVPEGFRDLAFADTSIPIGHGQTMLPPKVEGRMLQALDIGERDEVLEVGTGSGFFAACLGRLGQRVRSLEIFPELARQAAGNLQLVAANNVLVEVADAMQLDEDGRYDAIAVTGSLPLYDERFQRALRIGGRLVIVVGSAPVMEACRVIRVGPREWLRESLFETVIEPLIHAPQRAPFVF